MTSAYLTVAQLAAELGVSHMTVRRRIDAGEIEWTDVGDRNARRASIRISRAAANAYLKTRTKPAKRRVA